MNIRKRIIITTVISLIAIGGITGVIALNSSPKAAEPASASGTYIQNLTTEEETSNCCTN